MSIKFIDDLTFDIYIKKETLNNINFKNNESIEKYLKELFKKLKDKYSLEISGFYEITVYIDKYYGVIIHLKKDNLEYYDYFQNQIDMRLRIEDTEFLYLVNDIPNYLLDKVEIIIKDKNIYLKLKKKLNKLEMMNLLENSEIKYDI